MAYQSMSGAVAQKRIDEAAQKFARQIADEVLSLSDAHEMLRISKTMSIFEIAGLAKAIACFQCEAAS